MTDKAKDDKAYRKLMENWKADSQQEAARQLRGDPMKLSPPYALDEHLDKLAIKYGQRR